MSAQERGRPRATRQRAAISGALDRAGGFRSAQDIHEALRSEGSKVGLTTVYRNLQMLVDAGEVDVFRPPDGEALYRRCEAEGHHHHLICRSCGSSIEIHDDEVEAWATAIGTRHGFTSVTHMVEVFGICKGCAAD